MMRPKIGRLLFLLLFLGFLYGYFNPKPVALPYYRADLWMHFLSCALVTLAAYLVFPRRYLVRITMVAVLIALALEPLQYILQPVNRTAAFDDAIANLIGVALALLIRVLLFRPSR